jgi:dTMP kinase
LAAFAQRRCIYTSACSALTLLRPASRGVAGLFISFEGIDGSGKSTQARLLFDALIAGGRRAHLTREPGGSAGAEDIRALVLNGAADRWSPETELLLFTAARRDHLEKTIRPRLAAGEVVICDRFADSTRIYQGLTRGDLRESVDALHSLMVGIEPDLTVLIDIPAEAGLARATARAGADMRFEGMGLAVQQAARAGFLALAAAHPARFAVIDGARDQASVARDVWDLARARMAAAP